MDEIKDINSQEQILYKKDAEILSVFIKKILNELNLK